MPNDPQHILIVDDEQDIRNLLRLTLEANGYVCHMAENAKAAIEVLREESVDLALMDIIMPEMTGLSLAKYVKETFPGIAIVFVTSVDDMNLAFDCVKEGADDYIMKSKIRSHVLQAVGQALERRKASRERDRQLGHLVDLVQDQAMELQHKSQEIIALNRMFQEKLEVKSDEATEPDLDWGLLNVFESIPWLTERDANADH